MQQFFEYSDEVRQAIESNKPILALESTLLTHGLPFPINLEAARLSELIAEGNGAVPAIIALMDGKIKIGLTKKELETLTGDKQVVKASVRDIPFVLSRKGNAGTTVASTLFCAHRAGIKVFATGGIGGVHRGEDNDISADLIELSKTPMAVVCAGAKAILDLPKTLEFLETYSIPVIGYRTDNFPAFYTANTKYKLHTNVHGIHSLYECLKIHWQLGMSSGVLIANPISTDHEIPEEVIEPVIKQALVKAEQLNIRGKDITPFLLNEILNVTEGKSLNANMSLILDNVELGAKLALEINREEKIEKKRYDTVRCA